MNLEGVRGATGPMELVIIGTIAKAHGRFGEVAVNPLSDSPSRFVGLPRLFLERTGLDPDEFRVESVRVHKGRPVVKLDGVSSITEAQALAGRAVGVPSSEIESPPDGSFYHFELVGLEVHDERLGFIGTASEILSTGGTDVIVVTTPDESEVLLPLCSEICRRVDPAKGRIDIAAPDGLLEANAR